MKMKEWFVVYPDDGYTETAFFETEQEAVDYATEQIDRFLMDVWDEDVENIVVGRMHFTAQKTNIVPLDGDDDWQAKIEYTCDYEILPVNPAPITGEKPNE